MLFSKGGKQEFPQHAAKEKPPLQWMFCCHVCCGSLAVSIQHFLGNFFFYLEIQGEFDQILTQLINVFDSPYPEV